MSDDKLARWLAKFATTVAPLYENGDDLTKIAAELRALLQEDPDYIAEKQTRDPLPGEIDAHFVRAHAEARERYGEAMALLRWLHEKATAEEITFNVDSWISTAAEFDQWRKKVDRFLATQEARDEH